MRLTLVSLALLAGGASSLSAQSVDGSPEAARQVVVRYYAAIDHGDFAGAYQRWGDGGHRSGKTYAAFARGFAGTAHTKVVAGTPTNGEGAAGSSYITVPVRVDATLKNGRRQHFVGSYVLRRVNDIDGATPEQLHWHIDSAVLKPAR